MKKSNPYYPIALILIIIGAGYMLYTGYFSKPHVDVAAYQKICTQYLQAAPGRYSDDQLQLLVYKINYLFPDSADKLTVPAEHELKLCAIKLEDKLKAKK